jgi:hypothetical protein
MGFALVLGIGVIVSLFSAIFVTRTFLEVVLSQRWAHSDRMFGMHIEQTQIGGAAIPSRRAAAVSTRG